MESNVLYDYDKVIYLDINLSEIKERDIIYSSELNNEFLSMMNANFSNEDPIQIANLMPNSLSKELIEPLSIISLPQVIENLNPTDRFEFYSYIESAKIYAFRAPKECVYIDLKNSITSEGTLIDLRAPLNMSDSIETIEKLVIVSISKDGIGGISVGVHEKSMHPHIGIDWRILTSERFYDYISRKEVTEDLYDNKSMTQLGYAIRPYELNNYQRVYIDEGKIVITS